MIKWMIILEITGKIKYCFLDKGWMKREVELEFVSKLKMKVSLLYNGSYNFVILRILQFIKYSFLVSITHRSVAILFMINDPLQ